MSVPIPPGQKPETNDEASRLDRLGAVILTYGAEPGHLPLLNGIIDEHGIQPSEIFVAHNPSGAVDYDAPLSSRGETVICLEANLGYAGGMNAGVRAAVASGADWILLLTPSLEFLPGAVQALSAAAASEERLGVLAPVLMWPDGRIYSTGVRRANRASLHDRRPLAPGSVARVQGVDGAAMLVRADAYLAVGGLDERFFMYWEETDFCSRCINHGWGIGVVANAGAVSDPGGPSRPAAYSYLMVRNGLEYARRHGGTAAMIAYGLAHLKLLLRLTVGASIPGRSTGTRGRAAILWWFGTVYGITDFARRRWGKPPGAIRRASDIE